MTRLSRKRRIKVRANWTIQSRSIQWNGVYGKECCIPTISYKLEMEVEDDCPSDIAELFADFSLANNEEGKVELPDGTLLVNIEQDSNEVEKLVGSLARQVRWELSSLLASGKGVRLSCKAIS